MNSIESGSSCSSKEKEVLPAIKNLDWDSEFFGLNIASINTENKNIDFGEIEKFVKENKIELIQACCNISDRSTINKLEKGGFNFQDLRVTYSIDLDKVSPGEKKIIFAEEKDIQELREIAGEVFFEDSRFNHEKIDKEKVKKFYQTWAEKAVYGTFDDFCIKTEEDGNIAGFITGKLQGDVAKIGLVGVSREYQGKGIGRKLMNAFFSYCLEKKMLKAEVVTEGTNLNANRHYIKNGYNLNSIESWYYKTY